MWNDYVWLEFLTKFFFGSLKFDQGETNESKATFRKIIYLNKLFQQRFFRDPMNMIKNFNKNSLMETLCFITLYLDLQRLAVIWTFKKAYLEYHFAFEGVAMF